MSEKQTLEYLKKNLELTDWWKDFVDGKTSLIESDIDKVLRAMPYTDATASVEIARKMDHQLSFVAARDTWYAWNGIVHAPCDGHSISVKVAKLLWAAMSKALGFVKEYYEKAAATLRTNGTPTGPAEATALMKSYEIIWGDHRMYRDRLASEAGMTALSRMMRIECDVDKDHFEDDTQWFVMRNWVMDLEDLKQGKWTLLPHSPKRNVTKYFDADYPDDPAKANLGHWDNYLKKSIPDESQRQYLQTAIGAGFTGIGKLRAIISIVGPPGTGKSLFLDALSELGSEGYSKTPSGNSIMKANGQNFAQDEYRGARIVAISEPPTGKTDDDFLKGITGDNKATTRTLNARESSWVPQCLLLIASNAGLKINSRDTAIVERVQQISFPVRFYPPNTPGIAEEFIQIRGLDKLILRDRSRVLMWIIAGMRRFINDGMVLTPPDSVIVQRDKVMTDGSTALRWVNEMKDEDGIIAVNYDVAKSHFLLVAEAYENYKNWAMSAGEKPLSKMFFAKDIYAKYGEKSDSGGRRFTGIVKTDVWAEKYDQMNWMGRN